MLLVKDVGMIPYTLQKSFGYKSKVVTVPIDHYDYNNLYTKGLELEFFDVPEDKKNYASVYENRYEYKLIKAYLKKNARQIDVLNLYHWTIPHALLFAFYKKLNPKGITYLKMDSYYTELPKKKFDFLRGRPIKEFVKKLLFKNIDIISCESVQSVKGFSNYYKKEVAYIPDGFFDFGDKDKELLKKKKNVFLCVGRPGLRQKNTESLVRAFSKIYKDCDWNLKLVGTSDEGDYKKFLAFFEETLSKNPGMRERVELLGRVEDRNLLDSLYTEAKVFVLPSRWESFGIVAAEALAKGDYLILTEGVAPYKEFTDNGKFGKVLPIEDDEALAKAMLETTRMNFDCDAMVDYAYGNFSWDVICGRLDKLIKDKNK